MMKYGQSQALGAEARAMTKPWFVQDMALLASVRSQLEDRISSLELVLGDQVMHATGVFGVLSGPPPQIDEFKLELEFPTEFPDKFPIVLEIGGRLPRERERHVNQDGSLCLEVPERIWQIAGSPINLKAFLDELVNGFFLQQIYFESEKRFLRPWSHELLGRLEFYYGYLPEARGRNKVLKECLKLIRRGPTPSRIKCPICKCPRLARCHQVALERLREEVNPGCIREVLASLP